MPQAAGLGQLVFLHLNGEAPYKEDRYWTALVGSNPLRIAYPAFVARPHAIAYATVQSRQIGAAVRTEKVEDITAIAIQNLADHMGRIQGKAIARAVGKFAAGAALEGIGKAEGGRAGSVLGLAGALWNIGNAVAEQADKRSWTTLPANVTAAELWLPPGANAVDVSYHDAQGQVLERASFSAEVKPGQTVFLSHRTYR